MELVKLVAIFGVLVMLIALKKPLSWAVLASIITACILFLIQPLQILKILIGSVLGAETLTMVIVMYLVTLLQRMMQSKGHIELAEGALSALFNSRRINASAAPIFIGLLPTAGAAFIAGDMVKGAVGDFLTSEEKAAVTSLFRHIPEAFMPTYSAILLALTLSGVTADSFVLGMALPTVLFLVLGYLFFLRKVPKETGIDHAGTKRQHLTDLFFGMWTMALIIVLILVFKVQVHIAAIGVIVLYFFVCRFKVKNLLPMLKSAFETNIMVNLVLLMFFKDILTETGVINALPDLFQSLPIPQFLLFMLIFFFGTLVSGSQAIIAVCMPMAYAAIPGGGMPLLVLLMCASFAAMQISPTHICLALISEYFKVNLGSLIRKLLPSVVIFMVFTPLYYLLLQSFSTFF